MDAKETQTTEQQDTTQQQQAESAVQIAPEAKAEQAQVPADNLSDEAKLAAEALAATEPEPAGDTPEIAGMKREDERLIGAITAKRQLNRELDRKIAEKLAAEEAAKPPEKSPLEIYIDENPDSEFTPPAVSLADQKWHREQAVKRQKDQEASSVSSRFNAATLEARKKFSDFDEILVSAEDLLTEGDQVDIKAAIKRGEDGAEALYKRCIYKTLLAGGDRAKELRAKLQKKNVTKASVQTTQTSQQTGGSETQKVEVPAKPPASAEEALHNPTLAHIYAAYGYEG